MKWIGALLVVFGCGGFGSMLVFNHKKTENTLRQLITALDFMECELRYRLTPLPQLCRQTAAERTGIVRVLFSNLAQELEDQVSPDVQCCMNAALVKTGELPSQVRQILKILGQTLGRFDIDGQLKGLNAARSECRRALEELTRDKDLRLRSYQTLGLCAGAALAILFL